MMKIRWAVVSLVCAAALCTGTAWAAGASSGSNLNSHAESRAYGKLDNETDNKTDSKISDNKTDSNVDSRRFDFEDRQEDDDTVRTITVSASKSVKVVPDMAQFAFGVTNTDKDAAKAQKANTKAINDVISKLKKLGVDEKSITTSNYSMYPQYDYSNNKQELTGYQVRTTLTVRDQTIEDAGNIIAQCVDAGINDIDYINFLCSGYDDAYQEALGEAVKATQTKAEAMAKAAGKKLGDVITITEGYQDTSSSYTNRASGSTMMAAEDLSFMAGESEISANVTVTYEIR